MEWKMSSNQLTETDGSPVDTMTFNTIITINAIFHSCTQTTQTGEGECLFFPELRRQHTLTNKTNSTRPYLRFIQSEFGDSI